MIERLNRLNENVYTILGELYENAEALSSDQLRYMQAVVSDVYKLEAELLLRDLKIEVKEHDYALKCKEAERVPRSRRRFWIFGKRIRNVAAETIEEVESFAAEEYFGNKQAELTARRKGRGDAPWEEKK